MGKNKIIIIGGGASGIIAGIIAARQGSKVTILDRCDRIGKKILATGNGRCNLTNKNICDDNYFFDKAHTGFVRDILEQFNVDATLKFFKELGIEVVEKDEGKLYPRSDQASSILAVLMVELQHLKVEVVCDQEVIGIELGQNIRVLTQNEKYYCNKLILAAGGQSTPDLGSNGSGFRLAGNIGHTINPVFPSLVQLKTDYAFLKHLKGTKIQGTVTLLDHQKNGLQMNSGEILYTDYGISGPPVLQISRIASSRYHQGLDTYVLIDLMPEYSNEALELLLLERFTVMPYKTAESILIGLLNSRLILPLLKSSEVLLNKKATDITKEERKRIVYFIKSTLMKVTGVNVWSQSQVTAGGISLGEVKSTLESKLIKNIYFCGEILDVDGICGGYNLQWAWSSGVVAGRNASMEA